MAFLKPRILCPNKSATEGKTKSFKIQVNFLDSKPLEKTYKHFESKSISDETAGRKQQNHSRKGKIECETCQFHRNYEEAEVNSST